jgi:hypothetical protein
VDNRLILLVFRRVYALTYVLRRGMCEAMFNMFDVFFRASKKLAVDTRKPSFWLIALVLF